MHKIFLILCLSFLVMGCDKPDPEKTISKTWRMTYYKMGHEEVPPPFYRDYYIRLNRDHTFEIKMQDVQKGSWMLSDDKKKLLTYPQDKNQELEIDIVELSDSNLVLTNNQGSAPIRMAFKPW